MRGLLASVVDVGGLVQVAWVSLLSGVVVVALFSFGLLGASRASEARRDGRRGMAVVSGGLGVLALLAFAVTVVVGVTILVR